MGAVENDNYPTPQDLANAITRFCFELFPQKKLIIDPACGAGAFLLAARQLWETASFLGVDNEPKYAQSITSLGVPFVPTDFVQYAHALSQDWLNETTLVITNPPYSANLPERFLHAVALAARPGCHVAFLLRHSFLGGIDRALYFSENDSLRIKRDIAGRPKFNIESKNQDHSEYAVYIYETGYHGNYIGWQERLIWKPRHLKLLAKKNGAAPDLVLPAPKKTKKAKKAG
jgi:23S rRNA G2445 N2-methylase RlmL